jgi:hypothetical protein
MFEKIKMAVESLKNKKRTVKSSEISLNLSCSRDQTSQHDATMKRKFYVSISEIWNG